MWHKARRPCPLVCRSERHPVVFDRVYIFYIYHGRNWTVFILYPPCRTYPQDVSCTTLVSVYFSISKISFFSAQGASALKSGCKSTGFSPNRQMFSEKSFNFRLILTVVYILSADFTLFTLLYFTKEISRLMTQEREKRPVKMDENYTLMAKTKDQWQNLKEFIL